MFSNSAPIFEYVFHECAIIFDFPFIRLLWNCFSDIFIDNRFVIKFLLQLKFLFGIYKDDDVFKFIQILVLVKYNIFNTLDIVKNKLTEILGKENEEEELELDEFEKVEKINNIND